MDTPGTAVNVAWPASTPIPAVVRRSRAVFNTAVLQWLRLALFPVLLLVLLWLAAVVSPQTVHNANPGVIKWVLSSRASVTTALPVHALTLSQAFDLGVVSEKYRALTVHWI
jgi:hypothetical protein